ncbi:MAG: hypothetical protein ACRD01_14210 [Terriglobales bacterium]
MPGFGAGRLTGQILVMAAVVVSAAAAAGAQAAKGAKQAPGTFVLGDTQQVSAASVLGAFPGPKIGGPLPNPPAAQIPAIIHAFTSNEKLFRELLQNDYIYEESIKMQEYDPSGSPGGIYQQTNSITYTPQGIRQILCTFCPQPTLQYVQVTEDDLTDMFNMNYYTLSLDELPEYNVTYMEHVPLDQVNTYVFSIAPKTIVKGHRYFQGKVYVDDQKLMIVFSDGRVVPNQYDKHGNPTNTFLPFKVWRQEVDGKYYFPVYTLMQGVIPGGPGTAATPMKMVIQFTNYKRFRATTRILAVTTLPGETKPATPPALPKIPH